jgi:hypothetical protein
MYKVGVGAEVWVVRPWLPPQRRVGVLGYLPPVVALYLSPGASLFEGRSSKHTDLHHSRGDDGIFSLV